MPRRNTAPTGKRCGLSPPPSVGVLLMLVLYFGDNAGAVRTKAQEHIHTVRAEGADIVRVTEQSYAPGAVALALSAVSLFSDRQVVVLDTPSSLPEYEKETRGLLKAMADSPRTVIIIEGPLTGQARKRYQTHAADVYEEKKEAAGTFNVFGLAHALLARDKKTLWIRYRQAREAGIAPEQILGVLFWQVKAMRSAARSKNAQSAGLKASVYQSARRAQTHYTGKEMDRLSRDLVTLYHEGHAGTAIDTALEAWILRL